MSSIDDLVNQLQMISGELADKSLDTLREAHRQGESKRPDLERTFTQARRAVEKAIQLLERRSLDD